MDALNAADHNLQQIGSRMILPSSFSGGERQMRELYQDSMAIVRKYGRPDYFITFTCNPKWPEITAELKEGQTWQDRPDLVSRVFHLKFEELMKDLKERKVLGLIQGFAWVIEFQKRGLPHAHILLIVDDQSKLQTVEDIDSVVSAEIPDPATYPEVYATVTRCLVHGPCGVHNRNAMCMTEGKCSKGYPRGFVEETRADRGGYPIYRRRSSGFIFKDGKGRDVDNRWIVPHNLYLTSKYDAHINVEVGTVVCIILYS
jgi:hypothetical protein